MLKLIRSLFHQTHRPDEREVAAIVERAWIDNMEESAWRFGHVRPWARAIFVARMTGFICGFYKAHGYYPTGQHRVDGRDCYFAPRSLMFKSPVHSPA